MKLKSSISMVSIPSARLEETVAFYENLLGIDLIGSLEENNDSFHAPISQDGIDLMVSRQRSPQETVTVWFAVNNLDEAIGEVRNLGGQVVWGPAPITMSARAFELYDQAYRRISPNGPRSRSEMARVVVVQDPGGGTLGLMQLEDHVHEHFKFGRFQQELDKRQEDFHTMGRLNARKLRGLREGIPD